MELVKYGITDAAIATIKDQYMGLTIQSLDDKEGFEQVHEARMVVKGKRVEVEKKRKELKADALEYGHKVDSEAKRIFALLEPIENHLVTEEKKVTDELERIKQEKIQAEEKRVEAIRTKIEGIKSLQMEAGIATSSPEIQSLIDRLSKFEITEENYQEFKGEADAVKTRTAEFFLERLNVYKAREEQEIAQKAEAERLENIHKEQAKAQAEIDTENKRIADEKAKMDAEKRAEQERKDREAFEAKTREDAKLEAERINKEEILRFEQKKKEREEAEAKEKERQEAIRPDREKLITYAQTLQNVFKPHVNDPKADSIMNDAARDLRLLTNRIIRRAEEL